jgi:hypothetical protein
MFSIMETMLNTSHAKKPSIYPDNLVVTGVFFSDGTVLLILLNLIVTTTYLSYVTITFSNNVHDRIKYKGS